MIHSLSITSFLLCALSVAAIASENTELDDAAKKREAARHYLSEQRKKLEELKASQFKTQTHQATLYAPTPSFFATFSDESDTEFPMFLQESETPQTNDEALSSIKEKAQNILDTLNTERTWGRASQQSAMLVELISAPTLPQSIKNNATIQELREKLITFNTLTENLMRAKKTRLYNSDRIPINGPEKSKEEIKAETAFKYWFYAYESFLQKL